MCFRKGKRIWCETLVIWRDLFSAMWGWSDIVTLPTNTNNKYIIIHLPLGAYLQENKPTPHSPKAKSTYSKVMRSSLQVAIGEIITGLANKSMRFCEISIYIRFTPEIPKTVRAVLGVKPGPRIWFHINAKNISTWLFTDASPGLQLESSWSREPKPGMGTKHSKRGGLMPPVY